MRFVIISVIHVILILLEYDVVGIVDIQFQTKTNKQEG